MKSSFKKCTTTLMKNKIKFKINIFKQQISNYNSKVQPISTSYNYFSIFFILICFCLNNIQSKSLIKYDYNLEDTNYYNEKTQYSINQRLNELDFLSTKKELSTIVSNEIEKNITKFSKFYIKNNISQLFPHCLYNFFHEIQRSFLYCNDQKLKSIPDFKSIYETFNQKILPKNPTFNLIFSKVDFSGSGINIIKKTDLKYLQIDMDNHFFFPGNDNFVDRAKKKFFPVFHLDFENISHIEDESFEEFINLNNKLRKMHLIRNISNSNSTMMNILNNKANDTINVEENFLKIRFNNCKFNFSPNRKPFKGLKAQEFHINHMNNENLANSIFDQSIINEFYLEQAPNFVSFLDLSNHLPTGKIMHKLVVLRSYKIHTLCSHSLPSFIHQETFYEIVITKCQTLTSINSFTFYKYPHLKTLILSYNNLRKINKDSFRYLTQLEVLDLNSNPISSLEDDTFKDLSSLRRLFLESTELKQIKQYTFTGLYSLNELRLSKSTKLSKINNNAFSDMIKSLKELHLKDTMISLIDSIEQDERIPPYITDTLTSNHIKKVWLEGLNLTLLNMDSYVNNDQISSIFQNSSHISLMCKLLRFVPPTTLVNLQRNQTCNCFVYLMFQEKNFPLYPKWEYKTPFCYRNQIITTNYHEKSEEKLRLFSNYDKIIERENECKLKSLKDFCFPSLLSVKKSKETTLKMRIRTTRKDIKQFSIATSPSPTKVRKLPKLDFTKLVQVILTISGISALSILLTILALRLSKILNKRKKDVKKAFTMRQRNSSQSSSVQISLNAVPSLNIVTNSTNNRRKTVVMPPSVIPALNTHSTPAIKLPAAKSEELSDLNPKLSQINFNQQNLNPINTTRLTSSPNKSTAILIQDINYSQNKFLISDSNND